MAAERSNEVALPGAPLRVGVVGLGYWGPNLVRTFMDSPLFEVAYLCDVDAAMPGPAAQTLRVQSGFTRESFERLAELIPGEDDTSRIGRLKYANPELIVLADVETASIAERNAPDNGL